MTQGAREAILMGFRFEQCLLQVWRNRIDGGCANANRVVSGGPGASSHCLRDNSRRFVSRSR